MAENDFSVKFEGKGVLPQTVKINDLIDVLENLNKLFKSILMEKIPNTKAEDIDIRIVSLEKGSILSNYLAPEISEKTLDEIGVVLQETLESKRASSIPKSGREPLRRINGFQKKYGCAFTYFTEDSEYAVNTAEVVFPEEFELSLSPKYKEITTIYATVTRIGGESPTAKLEIIPTGEKLTADISDLETAMKIANYLYKTVILQGIVTWDTETERIEHVEINNFIGQFDGDTQKGMELLKNIAGPFWDEIDDADSYIQKLRE